MSIVTNLSPREIAEVCMQALEACDALGCAPANLALEVRRCIANREADTAALAFCQVVAETMRATHAREAEEYYDEADEAADQDYNDLLDAAERHMCAEEACREIAEQIRAKISEVRSLPG